jgi:polyhydroxybutyrate depolymerase
VTARPWSGRRPPSGPRSSHTGRVRRSRLLALAVLVGALGGCSDAPVAQEVEIGSPTTDGDACALAPGPGRYVVTADGGTLRTVDDAGAAVDVLVRGLDGEARDALVAALAVHRRTIRVTVPDGPGPHDVLLEFHGYTSSAVQQSRYSQLSERAPEAGYLVVAVDGRDEPRRWELADTDPDPSAMGTSDVAVVDAAIGVVLETFCGDDGGIHATGMSNGSVFAAVLACHSDHDIRAVASIAFTTGTAGCDEDRQVPTLAIHGTADVVVPFAGRDAPLIEAVLGWALEPAEEAMELKAELNGCDEADDERIGADVIRRAWRGCEADTVLYVVDGGGHGWPGPVQPSSGFGRTTTTIDATELIVDFFDRH